MPDERPRPQYGEYATPQEQIIAGGIAVPSREEPSVHVRSADSRDSRAAATSSFPAPSPDSRIDGAAPSGSATELSPQKRPFDTFVATFLLSLNAFLVISSSSSWAELPATLRDTYTQLGYGEFTSIELASTMGTIIAVVQSLLLIGAAVVSIVRLRAKRSAWWVPLVFGIASVVVTLVLTAVVMMTDPALAAFIATQR